MTAPHPLAVEIIDAARAAGWDGAAPPRRFFHGTCAPLDVGDRLVPGGVAGCRNHEFSRSDRVYLAPSPGVAEVYAGDFHARHRAGECAGPRVLVVQAPGAVNADGSDPYSMEWTAPEAMVLAVMSPAEARAAERVFDDTCGRPERDPFVWLPFALQP